MFHLLLVSAPAPCTSFRAKSFQSCQTLCNPMDCSLPGSSVHNILQARILDWVAIPFSRGSSWPRDQTCISYISCIGSRVLYPLSHLGSPFFSLGGSKVTQPLTLYPTQVLWFPLLIATASNSLPNNWISRPRASRRDVQELEASVYLIVTSYHLYLKIRLEPNHVSRHHLGADATYSCLCAAVGSWRLPVSALDSLQSTRLERSDGSNMNTPLYGKQTANTALLHSTGNYMQ